MRLSKANIAGLISPLQQGEMKSILAGAWPPLKPLPVFKYETPEYRATIDFDKKRGEWVCRKISLPSNTVQELRGGLREITMALPHGEADIFTEDAGHPEHELEKDMNRRLQAIREWREKYESGVLYCELRDQLSEAQQSEMEDSLRLALTARQLQFNPKNAAYVFDALSSAGGRFATLIEFAKRKKAKPGPEPEVQGEAAVLEAECASVNDEQPLGSGSCEPECVVDNRPVREREAAERCTDADELPAVSIKNVLAEQEPPPLAERLLAERVPFHGASEALEIGNPGIVDADSASLGDPAYQEEPQPPAFADFAAQLQTGPASAGHTESSSRHFPAVEISAFQVAVFAALFLSAAFAFTVGLTVGRGPLASRLREVPKSMLGMDGRPPTQPAAAEESSLHVSAPVVTSGNESGSASRPGEATPAERKSEENTRGLEYFAKARSTDAEPAGSAVPAKREVSLEHSSEIDPESAARAVAPTMGIAPSPARSFTILVTRPAGGSQPFRVSFPEKTIAATSSLAMSSQLFVMVSAAPGARTGHKAARLETGELASFVWPRYPKRGNGHESGETIRVRATIGPLGQVREVKFLSGASALLPATKAAIRQWRYRPTLLDKRPVQAQQEVTIELRPAQYASRVATQRPAHN